MKHIAFRLSLLLLTVIFSSVVLAHELDDLKKRYTKREVMITMRDGIRLFTSIYEPKTSEPRPIIVRRTPYSCAPYGEEFRWNLVREWKNFTDANFIVVIQDVRGHHRSEGVFEHVRPLNKNRKVKGGKATDEATDTYDTVDWLVKNTRNNGRVGFWGFSYDGFFSTMAAFSQHPAVVAVSPQAPITDWFIGDDRHHGGAFTMLQTFDYIPQTEGRYRYTKDIYNKVIRNDVYTDLLNAGTYKNLTEILDDSTATLWHNFAKHPNYDEFWQERNVRNSCYNIKPAMLIVGGSYDTEDCFGAWELYKAVRKQSPQTEAYLTMGPWWHGGWAVRGYTGYDHFYFGEGTTDYFLDEVEFPFFSYYLDGKGTKPEKRVNTFFAGENRWGHFDDWPIENVEMTPFYIHRKGKVSTEKPQERMSFTEYISDMEHPVPFSPDPEDHRVREFDDQRFASARPDVITFVSEPLTDTLRIAGPIEAKLWAAISSTDADFVVKLIDEYPDGYRNPEEAERGTERKRYQMGKFQHVVRAEILRGRYRNSYEHPEPFVPGEVTPVTVRLNDASHTFLPGHSVMIQIQSSWFPLFDRNPQRFIDTYTCTTDDFVMKQTIRIYHQQNAPSAIVLPVMKK